MISQVSSFRLTTITACLLALITLVAAALRLYRAGDPLWIDELHTAWTTVDGLAQVAKRARLGNQSPVYFYLTWAATRFLGMSELSVRLPSLVAGILLVPFTFAAVLRWTNSRIAGLLAATLVATDRDFIFYAQEARPYAWVQLVGLLQVYAFSCLIAPAQHVTTVPSASPRHLLRAAFVGTSSLLFYLHYTACLMLLAELTCFFLLLLSKKWRPNYQSKQLLIDFGLGVAICLPSSHHLLDILSRRENWEAIAEDWPTRQLRRFAEVYVMIPLALTSCLLLIRWRLAVDLPLRRIDVRLVVLVVCWLAVPPLIAWFVSDIGIAALAIFRYVVVSALAPLIVTGFFCAVFQSRRVQAALALVAVSLAISTNDMPRQFFQDGRLVGDRNEDWPGAVRIINDAKATSRWPVFLYPDLIEDHLLAGDHDDAFRAFCLFPITGIHRVDSSRRRLIPRPTSCPIPLNDEDRQLVQQMGGAWLIVRGSRRTTDRVIASFSGSLERAAIRSSYDYAGGQRPQKERQAVRVVRFTVRR